MDKSIKEKVTFASGQEVYRQGQRARDAYLVERGKVELVKEFRGQRVVIGEAGPGDIFGELALLEDCDRMETATAIDAAVCVVISPRMFTEHMKSATPFVKHMLTAFARSVRNTHEQLHD